MRVQSNFAQSFSAALKRWPPLLLFILALVLGFAACSRVTTQEYDLVIRGGRVMDPESELDAIRNLGISDGKIHAVTTRELRGKTTIDAGGLIVAPGFIDLHSHGQTPENYRFQAADGVTSALELEVGTADIDGWYAEREAKTLIHYGVSIGHIPVRIQVMGDPGTFLPSGDAAHRAASEAEREEIKQGIRRGLERGATAVGFGVAYTQAATYWEILELFRVAAESGATAHVHVRAGERGIRGVEEVISASAVTGAAVHVVHIQSSGQDNTPRLLEMIAGARSRGIDITTECYPYTAGMTLLESALFDEGWRDKMGLDYADLQWIATGERLTARTFDRYRKIGGLVVIHTNPEEIVEGAVASPLTMIASDGLLENGKGHPRTSGTYSRVLGRYVRERGILSLMDALRKMTLMPAQRLGRRVPMMRNKGRIRVGADADLTLFDPERILDRSTYENPAVTSVGIQHVLVGGVPVVKDGQVQDDDNVLPGTPIRVPIQ